MELTVEVLGGHVGIALELLVEVDDGGGEDGEERTEAEDDDVTDGLGEGGVALEVTLLAGVLGEGGDEVIAEPLDDDIGRHGGWVISFVKLLSWHFASSLGRMSTSKVVIKTHAVLGKISSAFSRIQKYKSFIGKFSIERLNTKTDHVQTRLR